MKAILAVLLVLFGVSAQKHTVNPCGKLVAAITSAWKDEILPCKRAADAYRIRRGASFRTLYYACPDNNPLWQTYPPTLVTIQRANFRAWVQGWNSVLHNYYAMVTCLYYGGCDIQPYLEAGSTLEGVTLPYYIRMEAACPALHFLH